MSIIQFVTLIVAGVVNIASLIISFVGADPALTGLIQQIGEGVTIIAVAVLGYLGYKSPRKN
jgi:hypothetical protein